MSAGQGRVVPATRHLRTAARDARLANAVAVAWVALVLSLGRTVIEVVVTATGAFLLGVLALWAARKPPPAPRTMHARLPAVAAAAFCVALVLVPFAARRWAARDSPLTVLANQHAAVTAVLTVSADPRPLAAKGLAGQAQVAVATDAVSVIADGRAWSADGPVLVLAPAASWRSVLPGQRVRVDGASQPSLDPGSTGATLFARGPPQLLGAPPWWQRAAGTVRAGLRAAAAGLPGDERGLLPGLVDGDTSGLDPVLVERFRVAGLSHLVAVSGTNCSIMIGAVLLVLRRARVRPWACATVGAIALVAFVVVARPSPSVLRAAVMAAIALVSLATGRPRQALPALASAVLVLLVWDPLLCTDPGFVMSALATGALVVLAPGWASALRARRVPAGVAEAVAVAAAAHVVTAPVIAALAGRVSLVAIPANVLAEPAVPPATVLGFAASLIAPFWLGGAQALAWLASWPCRWLVLVADRAGALPGASLSWPGGPTGAVLLLAASLALIVLVRRRGPGRVLGVGIVLAVLVQVPARSIATGWPPHGWVMVACDVGQGDAIVLNAGDGAGVEIDAGPDPVAIDRCLRELGVRDVALLAFTHYHLDHVGGIVGVFRHRRVGRVITGPLADPIGGVELVHDALAAHGLGIATPAPGMQVDVGAVHLEVLGPATAFHGTRSDPNNSSLVLRATVGGVRILLPGDVEVEAQQTMLTAGVDVSADVLKVPHHGSAYFVAQFLADVHARVGVISVGLHNDYGHPSPLLLAELARLGIPTRRTDLDGDVAVVGPLSSLRTVVHGVSASAALGAPVGGAAHLSVPRVRMDRWRPAAPAPELLRGPPDLHHPSTWTTFPTRCHRSCWPSATRSCWEPAPSARSPPPLAGAIPTSSRPNAPAATSTVPSCTNCSVRRCSATPGCW